MSYPILIALNNEGRPYIGAKYIKQAVARGETIVSTERVYGIQLGYRVVAQLPDGAFVLTTKTRARELGAAITVAHPF